MSRSDVVILGAGPAGMAAAATAADLGLSVMLLDEQAHAGGQIYRDVDHVPEGRDYLLGADYTYGKTLTAGLSHDSITHVGGAAVWAIEDGCDVSYTLNGRGAHVSGGKLIIATGALERAMPLPGWTLPGVMTAGAGQIMLKQSGVLARRAVLVGSGPLLYLVAAQMVRAGVSPLAIVETQTRMDLIGASRHMTGALRGWRHLVKGVALLRALRRAGVTRFTGATDIAIEGDDQAEAVTFQCRGKAERLGCDTVFLHHGVVPNTQAARSIGVSHRWSTAQMCFSPVGGTWGDTNVDDVFVAGDGAGIGGAKVAEIAGRLAALKAAEELGALSPRKRDARAKPMHRALAGEMAIRSFLDVAYPPYARAIRPADDTTICRCEEVTAGDIRRYARIGCLGPNQAKAFGRAGMGPCQGRFCGLTVTALLAEANGQAPDETGYFRIRPPLKPVTLGEVSGMDE